MGHELEAAPSPEDPQGGTSGVVGEGQACDIGESILGDEPTHIVKSQEDLEAEFVAGEGDGQGELEVGAGAQGQGVACEAELVWDGLIQEREGVGGESRGGAEAPVAKLMLDGGSPSGASEPAWLGGQESDAAAGAEGDGRGLSLSRSIYQRKREGDEEGEEDPSGAVGAAGEEDDEPQEEGDEPWGGSAGGELGASSGALGEAGSASDIAGLLRAAMSVFRALRALSKGDLTDSAAAAGAVVVALHGLQDEEVVQGEVAGLIGAGEA